MNRKSQTLRSAVRRLAQSLRLLYQRRIKYSLKSVGAGVTIGKGTTIRPGCVSIGDYTFIGPHCALHADRISIGRFVMLAADVAIMDSDEGAAIVDTSVTPTKSGIIIEDDAWVGRGAIICQGVTIGEGAIIASGALVTENVRPYTIVGSPPARKVGESFSNRQEFEKFLAGL